MPTRSEIQDILAESQENVLTYFHELSTEDLERPRTPSGVPGEAPWRAKDHFAHLTANEQNIQTLLRVILMGASLPDTLTTMSAEERLAWANRRNQSYVDAHHNESMETLREQLTTARQETLALLEQFTEAQLAAPVPFSHLAHLTSGDLFAANARHATTHIAWIEEGFRQGLEGSKSTEDLYYCI